MQNKVRTHTRSVFLFALLFLALTLTGCFESDQDIILNPDGSGKLTLVAVFDPSAVTLGGGGGNAAQTAVKKLLEKSQGIDVWKDVTFTNTADGRVSFKGTAYFKDLSQVKIQNFGTDFTLTRDGKVVTITMQEENKKPAEGQAAKPQQMTEEQINDAVQQAKAEWQRSKPMLGAMLGGLKKSATLHFRGTLVEVNNFEKVSENAIKVSFDGARIIEILDQMMNDDAALRKQAMEGSLKAGGGPPEMDESFNEKFFGQPGPVKAKIQLDSKASFDYKKEVAAAQKMYPKLQETLGIVPKLPAGATIKDGVQFALGEIRDQRTTGEFFGGLSVELVMSGNLMPAIRGLRQISIATAVDDTGKNLLKEGEEAKPDPSREEETGTLKQKVELVNPLRSASTIKELSGSAVFYMPDKDPKAAKVVVKGFMKLTGKPLVLDVLKKAKVQVAVLTKDQYEAAQAAKEKLEGQDAKPANMGDALMSAFGEMFSGFMSVDENDLAFLVKDPGGRLVDLEVQDASGKPLPTQGRSTYEDKRTISFEQLPGADAQLVIYLETSAALVKSAFSFTNVTLP